jgi:hypothetical protein
MTNEQEKLYWKGVYFPGSLTKEEYAEWIVLVHKYDSIQPMSELEYKRWGYVMVAFLIVLILAAVFL